MGVGADAWRAGDGPKCERYQGMTARQSNVVLPRQGFDRVVAVVSCMCGRVGGDFDG